MYNEAVAENVTSIWVYFTIIFFLCQYLTGDIAIAILAGGESTFPSPFSKLKYGFFQGKDCY